MNILEEIKDAKSVGITGHIRPDGDCVGSTMGLYNFLKENRPDLDLRIYLDSLGDGFDFIKGIDEVRDSADSDMKFDVFIVLDCSSIDRIEPFADLFIMAKKTICIDHHVSNTDFADINLVESSWSSACEVLYTTLDEDKISLDVATCLYTGMIHDTGVFKYSQTSKQTMEIAGKLMELGVDFQDIIDNSFYAKSYIQNQILGRALLESVLFYDGKCIFSSISKEIMDFYGVDGKSLGGIVEQLRLTEGVEVAIFMYELSKGEYKVSLRSKKFIDVSKISMSFGGGGHVRAAGFSTKGNVHTIINKIGAMIEDQYKALS